MGIRQWFSTCTQPRVPVVSIVLSTFNRRDQLSRSLDALLALAPEPAHEIIVVDNNSSDGTRELVQARRAAHSRLRYIFEPTQGLPHARNAGILAAAAPVVAFTDDDVQVPPHWVARIQETFDAHPEVDVIGGPVRPIWPATVPSWLTRRQLGPFALGERGDVPMRVHAGNASPCLVGANFAFRRQVFDRVGLFDPAYTKSQDREIQMRLWRAGGQGLYVPALAIDVEIPPDRLTKTYFRYWYRTYGRFHSKMRLLDTIDHQGRLMPAPRRSLLGVPPFLYRELIGSVGRWLAGHARLDGDSAFYWENRARYLYSYIRERHRELA